MEGFNAHRYNEQTMKGLFREVYPLLAEQVLARTGIRAGQCLDIGGGPGMLGICLAEASDLRVTVVDPNADCVLLADENIAAHGLADRVEARLGWAETLPFADASIDLVVSRGSIYFWQDQRQGLIEVRRVLRPGGWGYIGGGFGNRQIRDQILARKADDKKWQDQRHERGEKFPPAFFRTLLSDLHIDGTVESGDAGMWMIFTKAEIST